MVAFQIRGLSLELDVARLFMEPFTRDVQVDFALDLRNRDTVDFHAILNSREIPESCGLNTEASEVIFESWKCLTETQRAGT